MKIVCYLLIILSLHSCEKISPKEPSAALSSDAKEQSAETLQDIKNEEDIRVSYDKTVRKVQKKVTDSTSFSYDCNGERNGTVTYFSENGELLLIQHTFNEYSHFSASNSYFIKDGNPFFVLSSESVWSFVNENQTKDNVTEKRFYIIDNKPIKCLQKDFSVITRSGHILKTDTTGNKVTECTEYAFKLKEFYSLLQLEHKKGLIGCPEGLTKK